MKHAFHIWTAVLSAGWISLIGPGTIEGKYFPVVDRVFMTAVQDENSSEWVYVSGSFFKLRNSCNPEYIRWRKGERGGNDSPVDYLWGAPEVRFAGFHVFENWHVQAAPPEVLLHESYADVFHRCRIGFGKFSVPTPWLTRTPFWN